MHKSLNEETCRTKAVIYARRTWAGLHHAASPPPFPLQPPSPPPSPTPEHTHAGPCTSAVSPADRQSCVRTQSAVGLRCTASVSAAVIDQDSIPYLRPQRRTDRQIQTAPIDPTVRNQNQLVSSALNIDSLPLQFCANTWPLQELASSMRERCRACIGGS